MRRWSWVIIIVFIVIVFVGFLYQWAGLKYYVRALIVINKMPVAERNLAWNEFSGTDQRSVERGILAGTWMNRVWIWKSTGLKSFAVDKYSIYSWFDGCSDTVKAKLKFGASNAIETVRYTDINSWRNKYKVGDYVAVFSTRSDQGGTKGNLREIYDYNFWLFMKKGIDTECAK